MTDQPPAPAPVATAPDPAPTPTAPATDPAAEVARLKSEIDQWKGHARTWEQRAKANSDAAQQAAQRDELLAKVAQTLGLEGAKPDPEAIARQLAAAQAQTAQLARERAVLLAANAAGADATALLDSRAFVSQLDGIDPGDTLAVSEAVKAAVAANPRYAAQHAAPPPAPKATSAGQFGQPAGNAQWTADDVAKASPEALARAMREGRLNAYMAS